MKRHFAALKMLTLTLLFVVALPLQQADARSGQDSVANDELFKRVESLDSALFDAFNRCDLKKLGSFFTPKVEFYQDTEGVTWSRQSLLKDIKTYICGKVRRELIPGTLEVYPIKGFGAIEIGDHRFCDVATGKCEGLAKFVHVWQNKRGVWKITRVISYAHRAAPSSSLNSQIQWRFVDRFQLSTENDSFWHSVCAGIREDAQPSEPDASE